MLRVTADTNILVSGLNFRRGKPFELLERYDSIRILNVANFLGLMQEQGERV